ncbi:MAG: PAS domain S-box protein [Patescibacteria group bacterium]|nr:PAS domain S-box protein [Patescibacteria group bacterium]
MRNRQESDHRHVRLTVIVIGLVVLGLGAVCSWFYNRQVGQALASLSPKGAAEMPRLGFEAWLMFVTAFSSVGAGLGFLYRLLLRQQKTIERQNEQLRRNNRNLEIALATRSLALHQTEKRLKTTLARLPVALWTLDADGRFIVAEGSGLQDLGLRPEDIINRTVEDACGRLPELIEQSRRALAGESFTVKLKATPKTLMLTYSPLKDAAGTVLGAMAVTLDITEAEAAADKVKRHETQLLELVEFLPEAVLVMADNSSVIYANYEAGRLVGCNDPKTLIGRSVMECIHPDSRAVVAERLRRLALGETVPTIIERLQRLDGTPFDAEVMSRAFLFGTQPAVLTVVRDVTEQRTAQDEMRRVSDLMKSVVDGAPLAFVGVDVDGHVNVWNRAAERLFGWKNRDIIGEPNPFIPEGKRDKYAGVTHRMLTGQPTADFQELCVCQDGSLVLCHIWPAPLKMGNRVVGCFFLLTEVKRA